MPNPVNLEALEWQEWRHSERIRLRFKAFEDEAEADAAHMGVCVQELPPGCCTNPAHYHMKERPSSGHPSFRRRAGDDLSPIDRIMSVPLPKRYRARGPLIEQAQHSPDAAPHPGEPVLGDDDALEIMSRL